MWPWPHGPVRRPSHWHPTTWSRTEALAVPWPRLHCSLTLWSQVGLARGTKLLLCSLCPEMGCPHPSPQQNSHCGPQETISLSHSCKTPGPGAITCPMGWRSPADAKQALTVPISTVHKWQEVGAFLMALLTSKCDLPWVANGWGMLLPKAAITTLFMVCCGKRVASYLVGT